jgi:hypothetical protein
MQGMRQEVRPGRTRSGVLPEAVQEPCGAGEVAQEGEAGAAISQEHGEMRDAIERSVGVTFVMIPLAVLWAKYVMHDWRMFWVGMGGSLTVSAFYIIRAAIKERRA